MEYFASIPDGAVITFPSKPHFYMKVCTGQGEGGVVDLVTGRLYLKQEIDNFPLGGNCTQVSQNLREHFRKTFPF